MEIPVTPYGNTRIIHHAWDFGHGWGLLSPGPAQSLLAQPPRRGIPYLSHLDPSPDPRVTGALGAGNNFSFNLLGFFPPNNPRNNSGSSPPIPSHGKSGAPLPSAGVSCCGTTPGGLGRSFPVLPPLQGVPLPWMRPVPVPRGLSHLTSVWFGVADTFQSEQKAPSGFFPACQVWLCRVTLHKVVTFGSSCLAHLCLAHLLLPLIPKIHILHSTRLVPTGVKPQGLIPKSSQINPEGILWPRGWGTG